VADVSLVDNNHARIKLIIKKEVRLSRDVQARIKSVGFLGDTFIELYQPGPVLVPLVAGDTISQVESGGDFGDVTNQISSIASDVKAITTTMKNLMAGENSSFSRSLLNIEKITDALSRVSVQNEQNVHAIVANLRAMSENLNGMVARNMGRVDGTMENMEAITDKVRSGQGTIGRLVNDEETVDKLNESIDNLNDLLGGANRTKLSLGYHTEYLGNSEEFKHYVSLDIKPKPDKYLMLDLVQDPSPDSSNQIRETKITSGGVTSTVLEEVETTNVDKFRFSAQLAKEFYNFRVRGGIIESTGGVGLDYKQGPIGVQLSAFDFETERGEKPHLKAMGTINVTKGVYLLGGMDDFISNQQDPDWFMGVGVQMDDDDLKNLMSLTSLRR
jgi:phospholipid/cholesterol/gamma-HCH transport system substrate-binding protein